MPKLITVITAEISQEEYVNLRYLSDTDACESISEGYRAIMNVPSDVEIDTYFEDTGE